MEINSAASSRYTQRDHISSRFTDKRDIILTLGAWWWGGRLVVVATLKGRALSKGGANHRGRARYIDKKCNICAILYNSYPYFPPQDINANFKVLQ